MSEAQVGHVLSPRPPPPGLGRAGQAQLWTVLLGIALIATFVALMFGRGPTEAMAVVFAACLFLATMMLLELGLVVVILGMLLSPEIPIGQFGARAVALRLQDLMVPILLLAWMGRKTLGIDRRTIIVDPVFLGMLMLVAIQLLSTYFGWLNAQIEFVTAGFYILKQFELFAMCAFVAQYVHTVKRARNFIRLAVVTAVIVALYGISMIPGTEVWTRNRVTAPFEGTPEPSTLGGYFVLIIGFIAALAIKAPDRRTRIRLLAVAGLLVIPLLYTLSRTSYVAFLVMISMLALLTRNRLLVVILVVGMLASPVVLPNEVIDRIMYTFNDHTKVFGIFDRSFGERLMIWQRVAWTMKHSPWLGGGVSYRHVLDSYYARVLIETGVFGFTVFALIIARLYVVAARVRRRHHDWWAQAFAIGYIAVLTGLLFHAVSAITFVIIRIMEPFWAATGTLLGLYMSLENQPDPKPEADATLATASARGRALAMPARRAWSNG